jgi:hypothetical protein
MVTGTTIMKVVLLKGYSREEIDSFPFMALITDLMFDKLANTGVYGVASGVA